MGNSIGNKTSFWSLVKDRITIPTLQRDYIYGAGTEKTEAVLNNMLDTFKRAILTGIEETLDFVYGSESKAKEFLPLDGQQRLTTLYLLHYYAALTAKHNNDFSEDDEAKIFEILGRFSYATRNCTIAFCNQLLIAKHKQLKDVVLNAKLEDNSPISDYLKDLDEFRGSFYTDPSVMSMMVVLDRIHHEFHDVENLWERLTADDCPINFYELDFGVFDLSDDLYNKMNSRGKPLTSFEILKAKMRKQIKNQDKEKADKIAVKLDTDWMQYVWECLDHTSELKKVDPAYMWLIKNLFRCFDYLSGYKKQRYEKLNDECMLANISFPSKVKALVSAFDTLASSHHMIPQEINEDYKVFVNDCIKGDMRNNRMLMLYAIYLGLFYKLDSTEFYYRYRHVRNLINNSADIIREEYMPMLLVDVRFVMKGLILERTSKKVNENSWKEEQEKERHREEWKKFFEYEDINEINGTLSAFAIGLNATNEITFGDSVFVAKLQTRLEKAAHFFKANLKSESERRSALLSLGSYAMAKQNQPAYRYFGIIMGSWQNFTGYHRYDERHHIMEAIDKIDVTRDMNSYVGDTSNVTPENWRFYAIKYASQIEVAYRRPDYGYIYFNDVDNSNPYDDNRGYLDAVVLQSSYYSSSNVAWKILHRVLEWTYGNKYHMYLYHLGGDQILLSKISNDAKLDMQSDGWHLIGINHEILDDVGIGYCLIAEASDEKLDEDGNIVESKRLSDVLVNHTQGVDYVDEGAKILQKLSQHYQSLLK